ncbi:MAG: hypothetical protein R3A45_11635 [Bdellovibrionota bacterium]
MWEITKASREPHWKYTDHFKMTAQLEAQAVQEADAAIAITEALKNLMYQRGVDKKYSSFQMLLTWHRFQPIVKDEELQ